MAGNRAFRPSNPETSDALQHVRLHGARIVEGAWRAAVVSGQDAGGRGRRAIYRWRTASGAPGRRHAAAWPSVPDRQRQREEWPGPVDRPGSAVVRRQRTVDRGIPRPDRPHDCVPADVEARSLRRQPRANDRSVVSTRGCGHGRGRLFARLAAAQLLLSCRGRPFDFAPQGHPSRQERLSGRTAWHVARDPGLVQGRPHGPVPDPGRKHRLACRARLAGSAGGRRAWPQLLPV